MTCGKAAITSTVTSRCNCGITSTAHPSQAASHRPHEIEVDLGEGVRGATGEMHAPGVEREAGVGRSRPVGVYSRAAARQDRTARRTARVEDGIDAGQEPLVVHDTLQLPHVRQPPVRMTGE